MRRGELVCRPHSWAQGGKGLVAGDQEPGGAVCGAQAPKLDSSSWYLGADPDKIVTSY